MWSSEDKNYSEDKTGNSSDQKSPRHYFNRKKLDKGEVDTAKRESNS